MAISGGIDWTTIQNAIHSWVVNGSGLPADKVIWAQQYAPRPAEPAISMRLSILDDIGVPWLDMENNYLTFADITITGVDATANTFTAVAHGRLTGDGPVKLTSTGTFPTGTNGTAKYWVVKITNDNFKLATTFRNAMAAVPVTIDITGTGSGTIKLIDTDATFRAGQELNYISRGFVRAALSLECFTSVGVGMDMATSILRRVASRRMLPSQTTILQNANIGLTEIQRVRALYGTKEVVIFEPRALVEVQLCLTNEELETGTIIEAVDVTDEINGSNFIIESE